MRLQSHQQSRIFQGLAAFALCTRARVCERECMFLLIKSEQRKRDESEKADEFLLFDLKLNKKLMFSFPFWIAPWLHHQYQSIRIKVQRICAHIA